MRRYLNSMKKSYIPLYTQTVGTVLHILLCYVFINHLDYGIQGASLATAVTYIFQLVVIMIYAQCQHDIRAAWFFPNKDTFRNLPRYLKIAIPGMLMLCL